MRLILFCAAVSMVSAQERVVLQTSTILDGKGGTSADRKLEPEAPVSATSMAAESLGMGDRIGTIAPGFEADLVATQGNPLGGSCL